MGLEGPIGRRACMTLWYCSIQGRVGRRFPWCVEDGRKQTVVDEKVNSNQAFLSFATRRKRDTS